MTIAKDMKYLVSYFLVILAIIYLMHTISSRKETKDYEKKDCKRQQDWAWLHAPSDGLVSQVNAYDTPWLR
jgi:hypothetical protein